MFGYVFLFLTRLINKGVRNRTNRPIIGLIIIAINRDKININGTRSERILAFCKKSPRVEKINSGKWIKINIPESEEGNSIATIQTRNGEIIRKINLSGGLNSIDALNIDIDQVYIKVETPGETILKKIQLR